MNVLPFSEALLIATLPSESLFGLTRRGFEGGVYAAADGEAMRIVVSFTNFVCLARRASPSRPWTSSSASVRRVAGVGVAGARARRPLDDARELRAPGPARPRAAMDLLARSRERSRQFRRRIERQIRVPPSPKPGFAGKGGGGGNRTRVRGRTGRSVYKRRLPFSFARRPVDSRPAAGLAILRCRASGDWLSLSAEPVR